MTRRGRLILHVGAAPGAGKTLSMIAAGQAAHDAGQKVLAAETAGWGRPVTEQAIQAMPWPVVAPSGLLATATSKRPDLVLLDDLVTHLHPRGPRRFDLVEPLLSRGIDVAAVANVFVLPEWHDAVQAIMGVEVPDRLPEPLAAEARRVHVAADPADLRRRFEDGDLFPLRGIPPFGRGLFQPAMLDLLSRLARRATGAVRPGQDFVVATVEAALHRVDLGETRPGLAAVRQVHPVLGWRRVAATVRRFTPGKRPRWPPAWRMPEDLAAALAGTPGARVWLATAHRARCPCCAGRVRTLADHPSVARLHVVAGAA